jgi:hypothetical protein
LLLCRVVLLLTLLLPLLILLPPGLLLLLLCSRACPAVAVAPASSVYPVALGVRQPEQSILESEIVRLY